VNTIDYKTWLEKVTSPDAKVDSDTAIVLPADAKTRLPLTDSPTLP
jgi:hypothetical protein